jgi:uncharacterized protein with FMN-binding domain
MHPLRRISPLLRITLVSTATVSGIVLLLSLKPHSTPRLTAAEPAASRTAGTVAGPGGSNTSVAKTVTGDVVQTMFGPVQVQIILQNGRITKAAALKYPQDTVIDQQINSYAIPQLNQEAVTAQSANIDAVSGATYTSQGYQQSLQSALDSAKG